MIERRFLRHEAAIDLNSNEKKCRADLDDDEASAAVVGTLIIDGGLVMRDVETLCGGTLLKRCRGSIGEGEGKKPRGNEKLHDDLVSNTT